MGGMTIGSTTTRPCLPTPQTGEGKSQVEVIPGLGEPFGRVFLARNRARWRLFLDREALFGRVFPARNRARWRYPPDSPRGGTKRIDYTTMNTAQVPISKGLVTSWSAINFGARNRCGYG